MEDAKLHNKDLYLMYAEIKGAVNGADHRVMFKHTRELGMPPSFVDTCKQLYEISATNYITASLHTFTLKEALYRGTHFHPSSLLSS
jgi:hypothetical protein